jgi:hypothetical protein
MTRVQAGVAMIFVTAAAMFIELRVMRIETFADGAGGSVYRFSRYSAWMMMLPAVCAVACDGAAGERVALAGAGDRAPAGGVGDHPDGRDVQPVHRSAGCGRERIDSARSRVSVS